MELIGALVGILLGLAILVFAWPLLLVIGVIGAIGIFIWGILGGGDDADL